MSIINGDKDNFNELINDELVLVDFYATWCGPCKMLTPVLEELANERSNVKVIKIDVDQNMELAKSHGIMSVPTLVLYKNGNIVGTNKGYMSKEELISWVDDKKVK